MSKKTKEIKTGEPGSEHKKKKNAVKLVLAVIPLVILGGCAAAVLPILVNYTKNAYERHTIESRENEYVMPEYPELDYTAPETESDAASEESTGENETAGDADKESKTVGDDKSDESGRLEKTGEEDNDGLNQLVPKYTGEDEDSDMYYPPVTSDLNPSPASDSGTSTAGSASSSGTNGTKYALPNNPDAKFSNSANALSVYGKEPIYKVDRIDPDVTNYLVVGTDSNDVTSYRGNSDVMIVVSYNKKAGTVKMTSLLRDCFVPIEGHDWGKLNSTYAIDGIGLTVNTVNQLFGLDIQSFVIIDFGGTKDFIDYVGGVDIYLTQAEADCYKLWSMGDFSEGMTHMDGKLALSHMRNREIGYDFGRTARQRDVITSLLKKIVTEKNVTEIYDIINYSFGLIKTNILVTDLAALGVSVMSAGSSLTIESDHIPHDDSFENAWYKGMQVLSFDIKKAAGMISDFIYGE